MFPSLSSTAWLALACLAGIVLISGLLLWAAWRRGVGASRSPQGTARRQGPSPTRAWKDEAEQLAELSRRADALRAQKSPQEQEPERTQKSE